MPDFNNMTLEQIENLQVEKDKELSAANDVYHTVKIQDLELAKQICELTNTRKDLAIALEKSKHIISQLRIERGIIETAKWQAKRR